MSKTFDQQNAIFAALGVSNGELHSPVQVQKLLFLLDRRIPSFFQNCFHFEAYHYGPFDATIYTQLEKMAFEGEAEIHGDAFSRQRRYRLTPKGQTKSEQLLSRLEPTVVQYIQELSSFVRSVSFADLVSAVYNEYPEMRANSVFRS